MRSVTTGAAAATSALERTLKPAGRNGCALASLCVDGAGAKRRHRFPDKGPPCPGQGGGVETGGAIAYPVNANGSGREVHAAQEVLKASILVGSPGCA